MVGDLHDIIVGGLEMRTSILHAIIVPIPHPHGSIKTGRGIRTIAQLNARIDMLLMPTQRMKVFLGLSNNIWGRWLVDGSLAASGLET